MIDMAKKPNKPAEKKRRKIVIKKPTRPSGVVEIDDVLRKVHYIQTERKSAKFKVTFDDDPVVNNILRDAELVWKRVVLDTCILYEVDPGEIRIEGEDALEGLEEFSDEIPEEGQIFD